MNAWAKSVWRPMVPMVKAIVIYSGPPVRQGEISLPSAKAVFGLTWLPARVLYCAALVHQHRRMPMRSDMKTSTPPPPN